MQKVRRSGRARGAGTRCEGAVGAWGAGAGRKGCSEPGASEESLLQGGKGLRGCSGATELFGVQGACVTRVGALAAPAAPLERAGPLKET